MIQFKRHRFPPYPLNLMQAKGIRKRIGAFILYFSQNYQTYRLLTELQCRSLRKESQKMVTQLSRYVKAQDVSQPATPQVQPELLLLDQQLWTLPPRHRITNYPL